MAHIKKYWMFYLGLLLLILIAYQFKLFGNKTTLFRMGGETPSPGPKPNTIPSRPFNQPFGTITTGTNCTESHNRCLSQGWSKDVCDDIAEKAGCRIV